VAERDGILNEEAQRRYRGYVESDLRDDPADIAKSDSSLLPMLVFGAWCGRYSRRRDVIAGIKGMADPLQDAVGRDALVARNLVRDAAVPPPPIWDGDEYEILAMSFAHLKQVDRIDVGSPNEPHGYGPSLRRLWFEAVADGLSGDQAWMRVHAWDRRRPVGEAPKPPRKRGAEPPPHPLAQYFARGLEWIDTGDLDHPWQTVADGVEWRVRLNDFPDEPMYSLIVAGTVVGDFNDWPATWAREGEPAVAPLASVAAAPRPPVDVNPATLLPRYLAGEHEAVWADLVALGPLVREEPCASPAWAVARETMRRARHNIELLIPRLEQLGYQFWDPAVITRQKRGMIANLLGGMEAMIGTDLPRYRAFLTRLDQLAASASKRDPRERIFAPLSSDELQEVATLEDEGWVLPLSLRAWIEEVGQVDFTGSHPTLGAMEGEPAFQGVYADPLMVFVDTDTMQEAFEEWREQPERKRRPHDLWISFDDRGKAGLAADEQVDDFYTLAIPEPAADAVLKGERHNTTFVGYLRLAFRWGGFPGWEGQPNPPTRELAVLTEGLLPL
jgi:hypothetical protein